MSFTVHKATDKDAEALVITMNEAHQFKIAQGDTAWDVEPFTLEEVLNSIERGNTYIISLDGRAAGSIELTWSDEQSWGPKGSDATAGYIHRLATRDGFRGRQIGERAILWACTQIRTAGRLYVRLDCPTANTKLCAYYEHLGFVKVGTKQIGNYVATLYEKQID